MCGGLQAQKDQKVLRFQKNQKSQPLRILLKIRQLCPAILTHPRSLCRPKWVQGCLQNSDDSGTGFALIPLNDSLNVDLISTISAGSNDAVNHLALHRTFRPLRQLPTLGLDW